MHERVVGEFRDRFGGPPTAVVRSPGRVNLIGEHTDYNDGFVLPLAIERAVWIAVRPRADDRVRVWTALGNKDAELTIGSLTRGSGWMAYLEGVTHELVSQGRELRGWDGAIVSDIPDGAGLSSSAALELGVARAFAHTSGFEWDPVDMALLCQRAENDWVGMNCGIMDQLICATGAHDRAMLIDCRDLSRLAIAIPNGSKVVILDTGTRRELVDSAYNDRRESCERAARIMDVPALRDVDTEMLDRWQGRLDDVAFRRARHVVSENAATRRFSDELAAGRLDDAGRLMKLSHDSMRDDFEISAPALDAMVEAASSAEGCYGARMTGGGFAGSCVALVDTAHIEGFVDETLRRYRSVSGLEGHAIPTAATAGTSIV